MVKRADSVNAVLDRRELPRLPEVDATVHGRRKRSPNGTRRDDYVPSEAARRKQASRMQVKIGREMKEILIKRGLLPGPVVPGVGHPTAGRVAASDAGMTTIINTALKLGGLETFAILEREPRSQGKSATIILTPTPELMALSRKYHYGPHLLIRAAAVKIALDLPDNLDQVAPAQG